MSELWGINSQLWEEMPESQDKLAIARTKVRTEIISHNYLWSFFIPWWKKNWIARCKLRILRKNVRIVTNSEFWGGKVRTVRYNLGILRKSLTCKIFEISKLGIARIGILSSQFWLFYTQFWKKGRIARKKVRLIRQKGTKTYLETLKTTYLSKITYVISIYKSLAIISSI